MTRLKQSSIGNLLPNGLGNITSRRVRSSSATLSVNLRFKLQDFQLASVRKQIVDHCIALRINLRLCNTRESKNDPTDLFSRLVSELRGPN